MKNIAKLRANFLLNKFILSACGHSLHSLYMSWLTKLNLGWGGLSILFHTSEKKHLS